MQRKVIFRAIGLSFLHFLVCVLAGALGWDWQMIIVSAMSILCLTAVYKWVSQSWLAGIFTIAPFYLLYIFMSIRVASYTTYSIWIWGMLLSSISLVLLQKKTKGIYAIPLLSLLVAIGGSIVFQNSYQLANQYKDPSRFRIQQSKLVDTAEQLVYHPAYKGKVVVLDLWHSACIPCIRQFPKIQELYNEFRSDSNVIIGTLNIPLPKDDGKRPLKIQKPYSFTKWFFLNESEYSKFNVEVVPFLLVYDKSGKCRYAGTFSIDRNVFLGNTRSLIKKLLHEKD